jgi:hypothetical protein
MLLPENISVLAMFGNELCVTPEYDVQNPHENMNELHHSNDSHHRASDGFFPRIVGVDKALMPCQPPK